LSEHLSKAQIEDYGRHTLSAAEYLSASRHMRDCEECRLQVEWVLGDEMFHGLKSEVFGDIGETEYALGEHAHLNFEQTAAYVEGGLRGDDLLRVNDHLTGCELCGMAVNDLLAFSKQVSPGLDREYQPPSASAVNESHWRRFVAAASSLSPRAPAWVVGSALAGVLLIAAGWLIWRAVKKDGKDPMTAHNSSSPQPTVVTPSPTQRAATVIAQLNDGSDRIELDGDGKLTGVEGAPPAYQRMIKDSLSSQRLDKSPLLAGLVRSGGLLRKGGDARDAGFSVIDPVGIVTLSDRPTFRWSSLDSATSYMVEVFDEKLNPIISGPQLTATTWTPPRSLKRGRIYSWQVTAFKNGDEVISPRPPAPAANFRILDEALANEVVQARRDFASSHLTLALVYTKAGLLDEAEQEVRALQKANPNSTLPNRLMASLQAMQR
jgi:hypothetical protein